MSLMFTLLLLMVVVVRGNVGWYTGEGNGNLKTHITFCHRTPRMERLRMSRIPLCFAGGVCPVSVVRLVAHQRTCQTDMRGIHCT
jgi:hypothetical protein